MTANEQRLVENFALAMPLREVEDADMLHFLAGLIQGHDHLREKLMEEHDQRKRRGKLEAMRPYLHFKACDAETYELAAIAKSVGSQPIYEVLT